MDRYKNNSRIAIDARSWGLSTGTYIRELLHEITHQNPPYDITIFTLTEHVEAVATLPNVTVVKADFEPYSLAEQFSFMRLLIRGRFDLVHFAMQNQPIFYWRKRVTTFHDLILLKTKINSRGRLRFVIYQLMARVAFKIILQLNAGVIAPSQFTKNELTRFARISPEKVTVTPLATRQVNEDLVRPLFPVPETFLLYVGNFYSYKNVHRLVEAHQELRKSFPDLGLVIVGRLHAPGIELREWVERKGYKGIIFTGYISDAVKNWFYHHAAVYAFPSTMEGFGLPGLEAMAHGTPVAASRATCIPEVLRDGASYFDPESTTSMMSVIASLLSDDETRRRLVAKGAEVVSTYSWSTTARLTLDSYARALRRAPQ